jgi:hypothetical protein
VIVLVCGGRDYENRSAVNIALDELCVRHARELMIIEGGAKGADRFAADWADETGLPHARVNALWVKHYNSAGPIRNQAMLLLKPDLVLAFPGGRGTADMVRRAEAAGIRVNKMDLNGDKA